MAANGTLRRWKRTCWDANGAELMHNDGTPSPITQQKRGWMLEYLDGLLLDDHNAINWKRLNASENGQHPTDAFPDGA